MHDPRVGRFFAVDPLEQKYPHNSPYAFSENRVIDAIELEGLEKILYTINFSNGQITTNKIVLKKAGPLGDGVAIKTNKSGEYTYFYGRPIEATGEKFVEAYEGVKDYVYDDGKGNKTVGIGHKLTPVEAKKYDFGDVVTQKQIDSWWNSDYKYWTNMVENKVTNISLPENKKDALADFAFNISNSTKKLISFNSQTTKGGKFFLEYMKDKSVQKRRYGEFVLYEDNLYLKFEPTIKYLNPNAKKKVFTNEYKILDELFNPKPKEEKKEKEKKL